MRSLIFLSLRRFAKEDRIQTLVQSFQLSIISNVCLSGDWTALKQQCYNQERVCQLVVSLGLQQYTHYEDTDLNDYVQQYAEQVGELLTYELCPRLSVL